MPSLFANLGHVMRSRDPSVENRRATRMLVDMVSHATAQGRTHGIQIINISALGLMCRSDADWLPGERVTVWLPILKDYPAEIRWCQDGRLGMEFIEPVRPTIYDGLMSLIPPRQQAW